MYPAVQETATTTLDPASYSEHSWYLDSQSVATHVDSPDTGPESSALTISSWLPTPEVPATSKDVTSYPHHYGLSESETATKFNLPLEFPVPNIMSAIPNAQVSSMTTNGAWHPECFGSQPGIAAHQGVCPTVESPSPSIWPRSPAVQKTTSTSTFPTWLSDKELCQEPQEQINNVSVTSFFIYTKFLNTYEDLGTS
ncbi:hypothetical protein F5I97DRAFT_236517 [Phlebopus sp. FC_14]|nr:hypothetical protein F5I97DRAFT_236517 [Phlebopus sp. FC_14]